MDLKQLVSLVVRLIGNAKAIPQLTEITSLNGQDFFVVHSNDLGKGAKISADNALVPVDIIVRGNYVTDFPKPGNLNKIYITEQEPVALYFWDQYLGEYVLVAGGEDKNFVHNQGTPSDTWIIAHNLNKYPSVTVMDSAKTVVEGTPIYVDLNNVRIEFNGQFSGTATLN